MRGETNTIKSTAMFAAAAAAAAASSHSAMAADLPAKAGPMAAPVPSWEGLYVGGSIGASWLNSVGDDSGNGFALPSGYGTIPGGQRTTSTAVGGIGGLDIGYNWQDRNFVYGLEADISWLANAKATSTGHLGTSAYYAASKTSRVNDLATFRGRFGFDFDGTMPYVTFGIAEGQIKNSYRFTASGYGGGLSSFSSHTSFQPGVVLGGGIEHAFTNHWTLRGELLWIGFKTDSFSPAGPAGYASTGAVAFTNSLVLGRIGLNYKF